MRKVSPTITDTEQQMDDFYTIMGDFYNKGEMHKHASPTKRLIAQKNSCWAHKEVIKDNMRAS